MHTLEKTDRRQKLCEEDVINIIVLERHGTSRGSLAKRYGVSYEQIRRIVTGMKWQSVHDKMKHQHILESLKKGN